MEKFDILEKSFSTRRGFLKSASVLTLGSFFLSSNTFKSSPEIGLQLYTIRDNIKEDLMTSLKKVSQIGYKNLEAAGYSNGQFYGKDPVELKKILSDLGMKMLSTHTGLQTVREGWEQKLDASAKVGCKYVVVPSLGQEERKTIDDYKRRAEEFNKAAEACKKHGMQFGYHNHAFEFEKINGQIPYEVLLEETDKKLVTFELDLYWAIKGGYKPEELFNKYPGRFELWHVKDMDNTPEKFFAAVGSGTIDFESIFAQKKKSGMKYFFVEQDRVKSGDPMDAIASSYQFLSKQRYL